MIRAECESCGAHLRGPDKSAGKTIKCPQCGGPVRVPRPADDEPESGLADLAAPDDAYGTDEPVLPRAVARPAAAADDGGAVDKPKKPKKKKKKARRRWFAADPDDGLSGTDVVICLVCPGIACIAGIVYLITGRGKGLQVLGLSFLGHLIWGAVRVAIELARQQ